MPYSESESEDQQAEETEQHKEEELGQELLLSDIPAGDPSTSKTSKINLLLQKLWHARHNEKQTKIKNAQLIERNMELYDRSKEILEKHKKTVERNSWLMKENAKLYRKLRELRQSMKSSAEAEVQLTTTEAGPSGLDTLANIATVFEEEQPVETQQEPTRRMTRSKGSASKKP